MDTITQPSGNNTSHLDQIWFAPWWLSCLVEKFASGAMVYNPCTGTTHYFNDLSLGIMDYLSRQPANGLTVATHLVDENPDSVLAISMVMNELEKSKFLFLWDG